MSPHDRDKDPVMKKQQNNNRTPKRPVPPRPPQRKPTPFGPARPLRTVLLWVILVLAVLVFVQVYGEIRAKTHEIPYSEFLQQIDQANIKLSLIHI